MKKKFWISSSYFKAKNIDELVMKMDELGFKRVELTAGLDYEENIANKLINYEKEGYEFLIHNYFPKPVDDFVINLSTENKELESKTLDLCMNSIKIASKLRNKVYSLHSGFAFEMTTDLIGNLEKQKSYLRNQEYNVEKNLEIMIKNSNKILRFADNLGVSIYFENNMIPNYNFKDVQNIPYHLIEPGGIKNFFERVEYANCGLMLDVSHAKIVSEILSINPYEFFNIDNIGYLQLSESDGFKDASETFNEKSWFFDKLSNFEKEFLILEIKETRISDFEKLEKNYPKDMKNLNNYTISHKASLYDGLKKMDLGSDGVLLILNGKKLIGILTDGDYRRLVIEKVDFNDSITLHANKKFTFSYEDESMEQKLTKLSRKINHLPIMSSNGDLKDLITSKDLLHIPISNPNISGNEKKYVLDAINSGWISSQGKYVKAFEDSLRDYLNTSKKNINLTTTSSGTAALELVLKALGIKKGDEVIVPTVTFGATASSIINIGARPVFVDVDLSTFNIDINLINNAVTKKTKAIIVVHLYGNPADLQKIDQICKKNNILLIEDAAEALGSKYKDEFCGLFGDAGIFSFFANKLITTGEGGAAIFKNTEHLKVALTIKNHGMDSKRKYWHNVVGNNYRLTNIQAALGLAQMEKIDSFLIRRKEIFEVYQKYFKRSDLFITPKIIKNTQSSYWLYPILRKEPHYDSFENLVEHFRKFSIETRPVFPPLHLQPAFREFNKKSMVISEKYFLHGVCLPISNKMSNKEVGIIKSCLESFFNEN